jgi:hypothetical protein
MGIELADILRRRAGCALHPEFRSGEISSNRLAQNLHDPIRARLELGLRAPRNYP